MSNPWENALKQLDMVREHLDMSDKEYQRLQTHDNVIKKNLTITMDDGSTKSFPAYRAQHNNSRGPYKGGIRYSNHVDEHDVKALSMWMSWKCAIAGIPYGGGKGGVTVDPRSLSELELMRLSHAYGSEFSEHIGIWKDVPGPDLGTNDVIMTWMRHGYEQAVGHHAPGVVTSKKLALDGIPLRTESTGRGGFHMLESLTKAIKGSPKDTRLAIQGLGNVGYWMGKYAIEAGYKLVAISDSNRGVYKSTGIDLEAVKAHKEQHGSLDEFKDAEPISNEELLELDVEVLVPGAIENVITKENASNIKAKYVLEMANGPTTPEADEILANNGITIIADVLANGGGVTVSYFEWAQNLGGYPWTGTMVFDRLEELMTSAFNNVWTIQQDRKVTGRVAAYIYGVGKVLEALRLREGK